MLRAPVATQSHTHTPNVRACVCSSTVDTAPAALLFHGNLFCGSAVNSAADPAYF